MSVNDVNENGETEFHESNCIECEELDDMYMVMCDECDRPMGTLSMCWGQRRNCKFILVLQIVQYYDQWFVVK